MPKNDRWCTICPLDSYYRDESNCLASPIELGEGIFIVKSPDWFLKFANDNYPSTEDPYPCRCHKRIISETKFVLLKEYEASSLGDPDPEWEGNKPRSLQDKALEYLQLANLSLWLAKPSRMGFDIVVDANFSNEEWVCRNSRRIDRIIFHENNKKSTLDASDYSLAKLLFPALLEPKNGTVWRSVVSLHWALVSRSWDLRYLTLWIALESLFGPETAQEISYRLSQRIAFFLTGNHGDAKDPYKKAKEGYIWRSKIVHGRSLEKLDTEESKQILYDAESLIRKSLNNILADEKLRKIFDNPQQREDFLDNLIFSE